jgi:autotransporter-associated beta strand protein
VEKSLDSFETNPSDLNKSIATLLRRKFIHVALGLSVGIFNFYSGNAIADCAPAGINNDWTCTGSTGTSSDTFGFQLGSTIGTLTNTGTILGYQSGMFNENRTVTTFNNEGTLSSNRLALEIWGTFHTINNSGGITVDSSIYTGGDTTLGVYNSRHTVDLFNNTGTISGANTGILNTYGGVITELRNAGSITANARAIENNTTITTINNTGSISGPEAGIYNTGTIGSISNTGSGTISSITNGGSINTYTGTLPSIYKILIAGSNAGQYGQISFGAVSGSMSFGIASSSSLSETTYLNVLSGIASNKLSSLSGSVVGTSYTWQLRPESTPTSWDLVVSTGISSVGTSQTISTSALSGSLPVTLTGGKLVASSGTIANPLAISADSVIDQNGTTTTIAGVISGAKKLSISNSTGTSGVIVLAADNSNFSGGIRVGAGANVSVGSASALGTGSLELVGTSTTPATLTTTADMTISNPISVSGDPVFNVAPAHTTTISAPITDGASSGDVVVSGGGTLNLTAVNTYTGPTTVDAGSTLSLSGSGSVSQSSGVTNNGTLNITGKTGNVSLAGYTQSSSGNLAMNFSPSNNQKILVSGAASLAGGLDLTAGSGVYKAGKYSLLTASAVTGTFGSFTSNLNSFTTLGFQLAYDSSNVYLVFTPNPVDTQQSLVNTASVLQNTYTLQNSVLANSFSYDCTEFGINNICLSVGGRNTAVQAANGLNNTSGLLIAAYRPHPNYRLGAYADQNLSVSNPGGTVNLGNNTPLMGLFGAWNENLDGTGAEVKVSAAYGQKNATVTRSVVGTSEPGTGSSQLNSQGAQFSMKYGFALTSGVIVAPYLGVRYTQNNMNGYTEAASTTVTAPLTYAALNTNATTALAGLGASYKATPVVTTFVSAGVETDTNTANGTYSATGIAGLKPLNFNANPVKTRPTATVGAYYDVAKNQRLGITGIYRQEPYQAVSTTTVMATFTVGL